MSKSEILFQSKLILEKHVCDILLKDTSNPGADGVEYYLEVLDENNTHVVEEERSFRVSGTWLAVNRIEEVDLLSYLIQFRRTLPETLTTSTRAPFTFPTWDRDTKLHKVGRLIGVYFKILPDEPLYPDYIRNSVTIEFFEILSILEFFTQQEIITRFELGSEAVVVEKEWYSKLQALLDSLKQRVVPKPATSVSRTTGPKVITSDITCAVPMLTKATCGLPVYKNAKCILHFEGEKDHAAFEKQVSRILFSKLNPIDCTGFIFPEGYQFPPRRRIEKDIVFLDCIFNGFVRLRDYVFCGQALFVSSRFNKGASFVSAEFQRTLEIRQCEFNRLDLGFVVFQDAFIFMTNSIISGLVVYPDDGQYALVNMKGAIFQAGQKVFIRDIRPYDIILGKTNLSSAGHLNFNGMSRKNNDTFRFGDERPSQLRQLGEKYRHEHFRTLVDSYQQVQRHLLSVRNYVDAGGFYEREMIIRRTHLTASWTEKLLYWSYGTFAFYGESLWRPACWLLILLIGVPLITVCGLGDMTLHFTGNLSDISTSICAYCEDFVRNAESLYSIRSNPFLSKFTSTTATIGWTWRLGLLFEKILAVVLISFIVINLRRRFRRY